jgi:hypothetical protein
MQPSLVIVPSNMPLKNLAKDLPYAMMILVSELKLESMRSAGLIHARARKRHIGKKSEVD